MSYWQQKVCLVTGASAGLGLSISRALAVRGARVIMFARKLGPLNDAVDLLSAAGGHVTPCAGDVTSAEDVVRVAEIVRSQFGGIDLLCNCAGQSTRQAALETTPEDFQQLWDVNFLSAVRMTRAFATDLMGRHGHIVNIGSLASKFGSRYYGGYPASKFALAAYSQQLRLELGSQGLHVLLVCPGPIKRAGGSQRSYAPAAGVPQNAEQPGGGVKLRGLDPDWLAERILASCERRQAELIVPSKVRLLLALSAISPRFGDWLLKKATGN